MIKKVLLFTISLTLLICFAYPGLAQELAPTAEENGQISLDIKGMDVVDVLKMLASRSGLNIVVGKNVSGRVTLFLKDVNIWDAFIIILLSNDLAYEEKGGIINVMTQREYEASYGRRFQDNKQAKIVQLQYAKATALSVALNQIRTTQGKVVADETSNTIVIIDTLEKIREMEEFIASADLPLEVRVFDLNYASAEPLSKKIEETITKGAGAIRIDERTNKIVVTDYPAKLDEISKIIEAFDEKTPQVLIDAQLIQVNPSDKLEMGVDWDYWLQKYFDIKASLAINTANTLLVSTATSTPTKEGEYKAVLDILRTIGDVKILSSPRIMVLNNEEARIHVGTRDAYITSTTSQAGTGTTVISQSVNFVDTGIQLHVTPTISRDGFVKMNIKPEISESTRTDIKSEGTITQVPIVSTSEAETTVMVKDGVTIIIGGLRKDKREKTVKKIPLLGDLPGIGFLFRSTSDNVTATELVILITPHIISGEHPLTEFAQIPPKAGARAKMVKGKIITEEIDTQPNISNSAYHNMIAQRIKNNTVRNTNSGQINGDIEISFTLDSRGHLLADPEIISASNQLLILPTLESIRGAAPFPSFPPGLNKTEERFQLTLEYK
ncbi:MAG: hypothetical protein ISS27_01200 [Candidatus Omnitrophica bacterium]|nr:hypothetical protein [Candidatus Omnitrophota bacterium]